MEGCRLSVECSWFGGKIGEGGVCVQLFVVALPRVAQAGGQNQQSTTPYVTWHKVLTVECLSVLYSNCSSAVKVVHHEQLHRGGV